MKRIMILVLATCLAAVAVLVPLGSSNAAASTRSKNSWEAKGWLVEGHLPHFDWAKCAVTHPALPNKNEATACYKPLGDKIYIHDDKADGHHVMAYLEVLNTGGNLNFRCHNYFGAGTWAVCKDWADEIPEHRGAGLTAASMEGDDVVNSGTIVQLDTTDG